MKLVERYTGWINTSDLLDLMYALGRDHPLWEDFKKRIVGNREAVHSLSIHPFDVQDIREAARKAGIEITTGESVEQDDGEE